jgi:Flp pilus assembly protein TadG
MQKTNHTQERHWESGQSLVEMALGFTMFLILVLGLLDLGRLFFIYIAMEDSASEAALYLALNGDCPVASSGAECADPNNALYRAQKASNVIEDAIDWEGTQLDYDFIAATATNEAMVEVWIEYPFGLITPIISDIVGDDTIVLRAEATHVRIVN